MAVVTYLLGLTAANSIVAVRLGPRGHRRVGRSPECAPEQRSAVDRQFLASRSETGPGVQPGHAPTRLWPGLEGTPRLRLVGCQGTLQISALPGYVDVETHALRPLDAWALIWADVRIRLGHGCQS